MLDISQYTKLSLNDQKAACRWLSRQNTEIIYAVLKRQKHKFFTLKSHYENEDLILLSLSALIISTVSVRNDLSANSTKNRTGDLHSVYQQTCLRSKQFKKNKPRPKYERLLNVKNVVITLIENEQYSYEDVRKYLFKFHRLTVSRQYLGSFYRNMKKGEQHV